MRIAFAKVMLVVAGGFVLASCDSESPVAPPADDLRASIVGSLPNDITLSGIAKLNARSPGLPFALGLSTSNRNMCVERTSQRDGHGRFASWAQRSWREAPQFNTRALQSDAVLGGYSALRFDRGTKERVSQIDCVLPIGDGAIPFMRERFATGHHSAAEFTLGGVVAAAFTGSFTCYWSQGSNTLDCGGVQCSAGFALRALSSTEYPLAASMNADGDSFSGSYVCDNGCTIYALLDGTGGYVCDGDDDWGGGDSGGGVGPGGGATNEADADCPMSNPRCLLPLSQAQRQKMIDALSMTDTTIAICKQAYDAVMEIQSAWRGGNAGIVDIPSRPNVHEHDATSRTGSNPLLHVDLDFLNTYMNATNLTGLGRLLLHEGFHLAEHPDHPGWDSGPTYYTPPYDKAPICIS